MSAAAYAIGQGAAYLGDKAINAGIGMMFQSDSQGFSREVLQNQKQWMVADLRKAGLNPILAAGGLGGSAGGGGGIATPGSGTLAETVRQGSLLKDAKRKLASEAVTAKNVAEQTGWDKRRAEHLMTQESDNAIIKQMERVQATASHDNVMRGIGSRTQLDKAGIPELGLTGSKLRMLNTVIQQLRGRDQNAAGRE